MQLSITRRTDLKPMPAFDSTLGFGRNFTDHMFLMDWKGEWQNPRIVPHGPLELDPAAMCFHYGQEIFEGMKVFRNASGRIQLFRSIDNFRRMSKSAARMVMPEVDADFLNEVLKTYVDMERKWIPDKKGYSLYIRPTMISTEAVLGVRPSEEYLFFMIACPVASFFPEQEGQLKAVKIFVSTDYVRAAPGGTGSAKTAGNYAASLSAQVEARKAGCQQVMWLDALERKYVEEVGTMNIFAVMDGKLITSPLTGTILAGITRDSVIQISRHMGISVEEKRFTIDELIDGIQSGTVTEVFGSGTAAIISPVNRISFKGNEYVVGNDGVGEVSERIYNQLLGIQYGTEVDPFNWIQEV